MNRVESMNGGDYIAIVTETIDNAWKSQTDEIAKTSSEIAAAIIRKNNVFVFGCSHAGIIAEEVFTVPAGLL